MAPHVPIHHGNDIVMLCFYNTTQVDAHSIFQGFILGLAGINTLNPTWPTVFIADHLQHFQTQHMVAFSRLIAFYMLVFSIIGIVKDAPPTVPVYTLEHLFAHATSTLSFSIYYHSTIKAQQKGSCKQWLHPFVLFHLLSVEL